MMFDLEPYLWLLTVLTVRLTVECFTYNLVFMKFANNVTILFMLFVYIYADKTTEHHCLQLALVWMVEISAIESCIGFWIIIKCIQVKVSVLV